MIKFWIQVLCTNFIFGLLLMLSDKVIKYAGEYGRKTSLAMTLFVIINLIVLVVGLLGIIWSF